MFSLNRLWNKQSSHQLFETWVGPVGTETGIYNQTSNIRGIKSQKLNIFHLVLQLFLSNPLKPGIELRMKM